MLRDFPKCAASRKGRTRRDADRPAPITMVETRYNLLREGMAQAARRALLLEVAALLQAPFRPFFAMSTASPGRAHYRDEPEDAVSGWTNAWTMRSRPRRHAHHGRADPDRHQGIWHGPDEIERIGHELETSSLPSRTRSVLYERNLGGSTGIVPIATRWPVTGCAWRYRAGDRERHRRHADQHDGRGEIASASTCATRRTCEATSRSFASARAGPVGMRQNGGMKGGAAG